MAARRASLTPASPGPSRPLRPPRLGSRATRVELGLLAFAPAMLLLAYRARAEPVWLLVFALPAVLGLAVAVGAAVVVHRGNAEPYSFTFVDDVGHEVVTHVGGYLLPAVVDVGRSTDEAVVAAVVLALVVHIHVATGRVHVNPLLYLVGYRTYRATTTTGVTYHVLARTDVTAWDDGERLVPLGASLLVERPRDRRRPSAPASSSTAAPAPAATSGSPTRGATGARS